MKRTDDTKLRMSRREMIGGIASGVLASTLGSPAVLAQNGKPFKIGALLSQSRVFAQLGDNVVRGLTLYLEQQNYQAGGRTIAVVREDDEGNPQVGLQKVRKLVESDEVDVVTGPIGSNVALGIVGYLKQSRTLYICSGAGVDALTRERGAPNIFRTSVSSWQSNAPPGAWIADHLFKEVIVVASDYSGGHEAINAFRQGFTGKGGKIVQEVYTPFGTNDFSAYFPQIRAANAPAAYVYMTGSDAVRFVTQYGQFGLRKTLPLLGTGFMVEQDELPAQGENAVGIKSGLQYASTLATPENKAFVDAYRAKYKEVPSCYSEYGFVTAKVICEALKATGGNADRKVLQDAVRAVKFAAPRGPFAFDPQTQNVVQNIYMREVVETGGQLENRVIATISDVRDPGTKG